MTIPLHAQIDPFALACSANLAEYISHLEAAKPQGSAMSDLTLAKLLQAEIKQLRLELAAQAGDNHD